MKHKKKVTGHESCNTSGQFASYKPKGGYKMRSVFARRRDSQSPSQPNPTPTPVLILFLSACLAAAGCGRALGGGGPEDPDGSVGRPDGSISCSTGDECVIAQPFDCCFGCPEIMTRSEMESRECWYEQGTDPGPVPEGCWMECYACPVCFPQPLDTHCENDQCVADDQGCPYTGNDPHPTAVTADIMHDPQSFTGHEYTVQGTVLPGLSGCDDNCPAENCCESAILIDGMVRLSGYPCDLGMTWWSDNYCAEEFRHNAWDTEGLKPGRRYEFIGTVNAGGAVPWDPPTMHLGGIRILEQEGMAGAFEITITEVIQDITDPTCEQVWDVGQQAKVYIAESESDVRIYAPVFSCWWTDHFWGSTQDQRNFDTWIPIDCDGCCCDYHLTGEVVRDTIAGSYESYDGMCRYTVRFAGTRLQ